MSARLHAHYYGDGDVFAPDTGDLVAIDSPFPPSSPSVTVDSAGEVEYTIELNFNMI